MVREVRCKSDGGVGLVNVTHANLASHRSNLVARIGM